MGIGKSRAHRMEAVRLRKDGQRICVGLSVSFGHCAVGEPSLGKLPDGVETRARRVLAAGLPL